MYTLRIYFLFVLTAVFLTTCSDDSNDPEIPSLPVADFVRVSDGFLAEIVSEELELPTSLAFAPDQSDRLFINELQTGNIRIISGGELQTEPFFTVETRVVGGFPSSGENGLLGIAFDPDFQNNGWIYFTYAERTDSGVVGRVARVQDVNGKGQNFQVLLGGIASAPGHQIESLAFGPDGKLYVSTGDAFRGDDAQNLDLLNGKILRMNPDGSIPADNPNPESYVYSLGHRNAFDLVFRPNGDLLSTENGTNEKDEFNIILPGANYGWPNALGVANNADYVNPIFVWQQIVAPSGMAIHSGTGFPPEFENALLLVLFGDTFSQGSSSRAKRIQRVTLSGTGLSTQVAFHEFITYATVLRGNPVDVTVAPNGWVYFTDIFRGGVYRVRPKE